jgi:hypothetical protein
LKEKETDKMKQPKGWVTVKSEYEMEKYMKPAKHKPWQKPVLGKISPVGISG